MKSAIIQAVDLVKECKPVMVQLEEARNQLREQVTLIKETERIPLMDAVGRILAEDGVAVQDQPPFSRSPLDGYAVRGKDTKGASLNQPKRLTVIGNVYAGQVFGGTVRENEAVRIMTGAPIPDGADTVIRQEDSDYGMKQVKIYRESKPYENYCPQGEDYKKGTVLLKKGCVLDGVSIAVLASLGNDLVSVYRKPKIAVISTGDEVIQPGNLLQPGKIYDSNLHFICGRLKELGITPIAYGHCEDEVEKMITQLERFAAQADLIITTGGVSVGQKDIMHEVVERLHAKQLFWKVAIKPGAPILAAVYKGVLMVCLSGNPFGAAANFELFVRPVLAALTGDSRWELKVQKAFLQSDYKKHGKYRRFLRGYTENGKVWIPSGNHASGVLASMIGCNCLIELSQDGARKGEEVWIHLL